jgi:hypothetical protein
MFEKVFIGLCYFVFLLFVAGLGGRRRSLLSPGGFAPAFHIATP